MEILRVEDRLAALFNNDEIFIVSAIDCIMQEPAPGMSYISAGVCKQDHSPPSPVELKPFIALLTQTIRHYAQLHRTSPDVILDQLNHDINTNKLVLKVDHDPETF